MMRRLLFVLALIWGNGFGIAQGLLRVQDEVVWGEDRLILIPKEAEGPQGPATLFPRTGGGKSKSVPRPPTNPANFGDWIQCVEDRVYSVQVRAAVTPEGKRAEVDVYRLDEPKGTWSRHAHLFWPQVFRPLLVSEHLLLGLGQSPKAFQEHGKAKPFAVFKRGESGEYSPRSYFDAGLEKPMFSEGGQWNYPALQPVLMFAQVARTRDHLVLGSGFGVFWIFSNRNGELRRVARIFPEATDERLRKGELWEGAVLGFQPRQDGAVLVSTLSEDLLLRGPLFRGERQARAQEGPQSFVQKERSVEEDLLRLSPRVDWYVLDPEDGKAREEIPPRGLPQTVRSSRELADFNWLFKADGNLHFYSEKEKNAVGSPGAGSELSPKSKSAKSR